MSASQKSFRFGVVPLVLLTFLALPGNAARAPRSSIQIDFKQCHSGQNGAGPCIYAPRPSTAVVNGWYNGAINNSNSWYRAGDFVPMRTVITGLTSAGTYTLRIGYIAFKGELHSYDYLGSYNASANPPNPNGLLRPPSNPPPDQAVVPCGSVADTAGPHNCTESPSVHAVPVDTNTHFPAGHSQAAGHFSAWGAALESAAYFDCGTDCGRIPPLSAAGNPTRERQINLTFRAEGPTVVLAWGAHIATALDWGFGKTSAEVGSGADASKMELVRLEGPGVTGNPTGGKTLSLNVNYGATGRLGGFTTHVTFAPNPPTPVVVNHPVTDTATLTARRSVPVTGMVRFFVCGPPPSPNPPTTGGCPPPNGADLGTDDVVPRSGSPNQYEASKDFTPTAAGRYCFRAEFTPNPAGHYSPRHHTNNLTVPTSNAECFTAMEARLTVTKACNPVNDGGHFNLLVNGQPWGGTAGENVACGGNTGAVDTTAGAKTVSETAGTSTDLANYEQPTFGGNCTDNGNGTGSITLAPGDVKVCDITNTRLVPPPPPTASLTVRKVCNPGNDPGRFEARVDGAPVAALNCGESTPDAVELAPDVAHTVSEAGVPPTSLSDYTTAISGACAANGSITLAPGQAAECTITNTRVPPPTTTLRVDKACVPAGDRGRFNLTIDGHVAGTGQNVGCGGTTGAVPVSPGSYKVGETAANGTLLAHYGVVIGGDCAANGTVTVAAGEQAVCVIKNVRRGVTPPPGLVCYTLHVARRMVTVGNVRVLARVHVRGHPIPGVRIYAVARGVSAVRTTGPNGQALFLLRLRHPGLLRVTIRQPYLCPKPPPHVIGVLGVRVPSITG